MTSYFQTEGRQLLANGYLIIPIKPGAKRPALDKWQNARLSATDLATYPTCGVGVLCGQGSQPIIGVDIDTSNAELAERMVTWCEEHLGITCARVGNAPKILLAYRAESEGWAKSMSAWYAVKWTKDATGKYVAVDGAPHRLEVLAKGQQFVSYHVHPDTGQPYDWVDYYGGLAHMRADMLPVVSQEQVVQLVEAFERFALDTGLLVKPNSTAQVGGVTSAPDDDPLMSHEPAVGLTLDEVNVLLKHVDNEDYDTWLKVGMSLHHEFSGSHDAMGLWDEWSATASNYGTSADIEMRWNSFDTSGRSITARWLLKVGNQGKRDAAREVFNDVKAVIADCADSSELLGAVARRAGEVAANDIAMRIELSSLIQSRFKSLTQSTVTIVDVRAAMAKQHTVTRFKDRKYHSTEFGNVARMMDQHGDGLMYVPEVGVWYAWSGVYWKRCAGVEIERLAKETILALPDEAKGLDEDARAAFFQFCAISQKANMVKNMEVLARSEAKVVVGVAELDRDMHLLGVGNGAVDLRTGELLAPDPLHRITTVTQTEYNPNACATLFEQTVSDVFFGDEEMAAFFQRLIGYSILGNPTEDFIVISHGNGSNGKSTLLNAIRSALGDHARMANADTFLSNAANASSAGGAREDLLRLRGARLVTVSEPEENSELRESLIKAMTGGDPMPARGMYSRTTIEVVPTWVTFISTNHTPIVKGDDHGIWRRLLLVPFTRNFDKDLTVDKDLDRAAKLAAESKGILAWMVRGALEYQRIGLRPPAAVRASHDAHKADMDLLAEWLEECCDVGKAHVDTNAKLWASWEAFAKAKGELRYISSNKLLGRRLEARGFEKFKNLYGIRERGYCGLRVRVVGDFAE